MPTQDEYDKLFMETAERFSGLSRCVSNKVGCVIVKDNRIISTGYNGTLPEQQNCAHKFPRYSKDQREVHYNWSLINEIHAEMNTISFAAKHGLSIDSATLYCTLKPCYSCLKNILQCGIKRIVYKNEYDKEIIGETIESFIKENNIIVEKI